jgi:hypothetical protein
MQCATCSINININAALYNTRTVAEAHLAPQAQVPKSQVMLLMRVPHRYSYKKWAAVTGSGRPLQAAVTGSGRPLQAAVTQTMP